MNKDRAIKEDFITFNKRLKFNIKRHREDLRAGITLMHNEANERINNAKNKYIYGVLEKVAALLYSRGPKHGVRFLTRLNYEVGDIQAIIVKYCGKNSIAASQKMLVLWGMDHIRHEIWALRQEWARAASRNYHLRKEIKAYSCRS